MIVGKSGTGVVGTSGLGQKPTSEQRDMADALEKALSEPRFCRQVAIKMQEHSGSEDEPEVEDARATVEEIVDKLRTGRPPVAQCGVTLEQALQAVQEARFLESMIRGNVSQPLVPMAPLTLPLRIQLPSDAPGMSLLDVRAQRPTAPTRVEPPPTQYSETEVGVFGIGPAGWVALEQFHDGKTRYAWDNSPLRAGEGVYNLDTMLDTAWQHATVDERVQLVAGYYEAVNLDPLDDHPLIALRTRIEQGATARAAVASVDVPYDTGDFSRHVASNTADGRLRAQATKVREIAFTSNATTVARYESKKALVDLLQENVKREAEGRPLIPVYLALRKQGADPQSHFVPDLSGTRDKTTEFTTDREIRMIYKLVEELPSAELRALARKTFHFVEQDATDESNRTFSVLPNPWDQLSQEQLGRSTSPNDNFAPNGPTLWATRTRSGGRAAYKDRAPQEVPVWARELEALRARLANGA